MPREPFRAVAERVLLVEGERATAPAEEREREPAAGDAVAELDAKQLALAATQYHDTSHSYPSGWYCDETLNTCVPYSSSPVMWSGQIGLLLYTEQRNLFNEMNFDVN